MPPDAPASLEALADALDAEMAGLEAQAILARARADPRVGALALVSSFGAESVALLHLAASVDPNMPVLFVDTEMLFPETLRYQAELAESLGLRDVRRVVPDPVVAASRDGDGLLHRRAADACCALRKTAPLMSALGPFDAWVTGRKRHQGGARARLRHVEAVEGRLKLNPLARWSRAQVAAHIDRHDLPRHPLVARGYPSIGCAPCTTPAAAGEDARAGRWRGRAKDECGIHFEDGRAMPAQRRDAA